MKVGIIGSGGVARALGLGFIQYGHDVKMGTRDPAKMKQWLATAGSRAAAGGLSDAAAFGEIVVLATRWDGAENAITLAGPERLAGKVVIDVTNPLASLPNAPPHLTIGFSDSAGEQVQRWLPQSRVVKAFNIVGNPFMVNPDFPGGPPDMFICGNDAAAKRRVTEICTTFGWPVIDIGGIEGSRLLEPLAMLWITYGVRTNTWAHAFKLLRRS